MDNAALKPGDRVAVWFYVTHATAHDVWLANKPGKPAIVDAPVSDIITAARRPKAASDDTLREMANTFMTHGGTDAEAMRAAVALLPARRPALPDREAVELILRDTLFVRHGYDDGEPLQDVGGIGDAADAILALFALSPAQAERDGWVLVPREPTEAMILAGAYGRRNGWRESTKATYQGMLSAAPKEEPDHG